MHELDAQMSPDAREAALHQSAAEITRLECLIARIEAMAPADEAALVEARIARFDKAIQDRANARQRAQQAVTRLQATIEAHVGVGLDEQIALAELELDRAKTERDALQREADVLELLSSELHAAESAAKERFLAPIQTRVTPYLRRLFGDGALQIDENLAITGLARARSGEESFTLLSCGTREQIAVLIRLAFADILAAKGKPAMLILDDVLSFADDTRRDAMFDILTAAAQRMQILVCSCHQQAFSGLPGTRLSVTTGSPMA